jgi:hypothetical protein
MDQGAQVDILAPAEGQTVAGVVTVTGSANVTDFVAYELQYGVSHTPGAFSPAIAGPFGTPVVNGVLGEWDVRGLNAGPHTLRLLVRDRAGALYERRVRLYVENVPPTVVPTWTPFPSYTPTWTALPTSTWTPLPPPPPAEPPTATATLTESPTATPVATLPLAPTLAPIETPTELPTEAPIWTPTWTPLPTETLPGPPPLTGSATLTVTGEITGTDVITP